ncbi:MAG: OmpA family protein [Candidatus Omnitrophica bacterium]|nr:OmpA family protein [Candidatus Omnitrophota bacterium]
MRNKKYLWAAVVIILSSSFFSSGCAVNFYKKNKRDRQQIKQLERQISELERKRMQEKEQFEETRRMLQKRLQQQIDDENVSLSMDERGLVIVLSDEILFDSGRAEIRKGAYPVLTQVGEVIVNKVPNKNIGISGHTDNIPIRHSSWKSNWELSTARATNVLHYLIEQGVSPDRLSATGYGEHRPVASNETAVGRAKNRRVEILILPEFTEKREEIQKEYIK